VQATNTIRWCIWPNRSLYINSRRIVFKNY